mmetsp:Transcript_10982/g.26905  ORF Transcript_10982/g.26905 Transcript_10982/m.26905 type:complete len:209 (+) Transcript_10982:137-763(+)|eukprot:CAMPEP_0178996476 /NCGR_PEP_ID=MMETSP0795-20121207/8386_1 /TAXON_ID=88552 /ORGANISM="Amoebophrya sp., Strain Ameob2" /LENGTH=208 /DNA_ID=CAMNT_0020688863 /DNA_START=118 /DNA_END=744 /DNA_ORIENTATION=-
MARNRNSATFRKVRLRFVVLMLKILTASIDRMTLLAFAAGRPGRGSGSGRALRKSGTSEAESASNREDSERTDDDEDDAAATTTATPVSEANPVNAVFFCVSLCSAVMLTVEMIAVGYFKFVATGGGGSVNASAKVELLAGPSEADQHEQDDEDDIMDYYDHTAWSTAGAEWDIFDGGGTGMNNPNLSPRGPIGSPRGALSPSPSPRY